MHSCRHDGSWLMELSYSLTMWSLRISWSVTCPVRLWRVFKSPFTWSLLTAPSCYCAWWMLLALLCLLLSSPAFILSNCGFTAVGSPLLNTIFISLPVHNPCLLDCMQLCQIIWKWKAVPHYEGLHQEIHFILFRADFWKSLWSTINYSNSLWRTATRLDLIRPYEQATEKHTSTCCCLSILAGFSSDPRSATMSYSFQSCKSFCGISIDFFEVTAMQS